MAAAVMQQAAHATNDNSPTRKHQDRDFNKADLLGEERNDKYDEIRRLPVIRKLNKSRFDDITIPDMQELCDAIDENHNGTLDFAEVCVLLKKVMVPPCTDVEIELLYQFTDQDDSGTVSAAELHSAFMAGPLKAHIKALQTEFKIKQKAAIAMGRGAPVDRDLLHDRIDWRVKRDDAFATLPFSMAVITNFILIVTTHLHIQQRARVSKGIEAWVTGYGNDLPGPYLEEHIGNTAQYWDWLRLSGLPSVLGDCPSHPASGLPRCRFASRNLLIGDAQLVKTGYDESVTSTWLLNSPEGSTHLAASPGDFVGAANAQASYLKSIDWADDSTLSLSLRFSGFCESEKVFTTNQVVVTFEKTGRIITNVVVATAMINPYADGPALYVLGGFYAFLILYPLYTELFELMASIKNSGVVEGFTDYMSLWNIVDWISIAAGIVNIVLWIQSCSAMGAPGIEQLLVGENKDKLLPSVMQLATDDIVIAQAAINGIVQLFFILHIVMGLNVLTIVLKFFKAFEANARLQLVTRTIMRARTDIVHFMIVFMAVFVAFAVTGHIYFGSDLAEFNTFMGSLNTCFVVLMGDFGWYTERADAGIPLQSGLPIGVMIAWFWSYMIFVLLVLLNMLLAIVLDHYAAVVNEMNKGNDFNTVWTQAQRYLQRSRETKGFIPLFDILCQLDDDAHQERRVTTKSLMKAFEGMRSDQAEWMMKWLSQEAANKMRETEDSETFTLLKEIEGLVETLSDEQKMMGLSTANLKAKLEDLREKLKKVRQEQADGGPVTVPVWASQEPGLDEPGLGPIPTSPISPNSPNYWSQRLTSKHAGRTVVDPMHPAHQLRQQAVMISDMADKIIELTSRVDKVVPQFRASEYRKPVPPALASLMKDISAIKMKLEELPRAEVGSAPVSAEGRPRSRWTEQLSARGSRELAKGITPRSAAEE